MSEKLVLAQNKNTPHQQHPEVIPIDRDQPVSAQIQADAARRLRPELVGLQWHKDGAKQVVLDHDVLVTLKQDIVLGIGKDGTGVWGSKNRVSEVKNSEVPINLWVVGTYDDEGQLTNIATYEGETLMETLDKQAKDSSAQLEGFAWNEKVTPSSAGSRTHRIYLKSTDKFFDELERQKDALKLDSLKGITWKKDGLKKRVVSEDTVTHHPKDKKAPAKVWRVKSWDKHGRVVESRFFADTSFAKFLEQEFTLSNMQSLNLTWEVEPQKAPVLNDAQKRWAAWLALHDEMQKVDPSLNPNFVIPRELEVTEANWDTLQDIGLLPLDPSQIGEAIRLYGKNFVHTGDAFDLTSGKPSAVLGGKGYYLHPDALSSDRTISDRTLAPMLSFGDTLDEANDREESEFLHEILENPQAALYFEQLKIVIGQVGKIKLIDLAEKIRTKAMEVCQAHSVSVDKETKSISWALWEIGKQSYFAANPNEADELNFDPESGIVPKNPLGENPYAIRKQTEIALGQAGYEFEKAVTAFVREKKIKNDEIVDGKLVLKKKGKLVVENGVQKWIQVPDYDTVAVSRLPEQIRVQVMQILVSGKRDEHEKLTPVERIKLGKLLAAPLSS